MKLTFLLSISTILFFSSCSNDSKPNDDNDQSEVSDESSRENEEVKDSVNTQEAETPSLKIDTAAIKSMSASELRILRNSVFAKYGKTFKSKDLQEHFEKQDWYNADPEYSDNLLTKEDRQFIETIQIWESKAGILWEKEIDMDGDGENEGIKVVKTSDDGDAVISVDGWSHKFKVYHKPDAYFYELKIMQIDIDKEDKSREIHISQRYGHDIDPGTENIFIAKSLSGMKATMIGSDDYDAGIVTIKGDGTLDMNQSNCPPHTKTFELKDGEVVFKSEDVGPVPQGGCAACFIGSSQVAISKTESKRIDELKNGDIILTHNFETGQDVPSEIVEMKRVFHENLVMLSFESTTIVSTDDHPYYIIRKGWCSFNPKATRAKYSNLTEVFPIQIGDQFRRIDGTAMVLKSISKLNEPKETFTITQLKKGSTFYVNEIMVGVEEINKPL